MYLKLPGASSVLPDAKVFKSCSRCPSQSESLSSGSLWSSGRYLLSMGGQGPEEEGVKSLKSSSLVLLVERPTPEVGVGESLKSFCLVLLVERPRPEVVVGDSLKSSSLHTSSQVLLVENRGLMSMEGLRMELLQDVPLAAQNLPEGQRQKGEMSAKKSRVGAARQEGAPWGSIGIRWRVPSPLKKPGPDVESAESLESSSLILFVEKTRPGVVGANTPDLGGAEGLASSSSSSSLSSPSSPSSPSSMSSPRGTMGQQRPKVEGAESLESSFLILFVEKKRPAVVGVNTPDLGGAEGGASSGRSSLGEETSRGATPKGKEQGCPGGKLGMNKLTFILDSVPDLTYLFLIRSVVDREITFIACRTIHDEVLRAWGGIQSEDFSQ
ncbi:hypothetical protein F7725_008237, partial [Dissostichus mawsoni]